VRSRAFTWVNLILATIVVVGVFVQTYLIGAYFTGAGANALDGHRIVGGLIVHPAEALVFLTSLAAFWGMWRWIGFNFLLIFLGTIQIFLAPPEGGDRSSGWVHGLHGLLALFVMIIAAVIVHRDMRALGLMRRRPVEPPPV
jgi:hypothetical protein